MLDLLRCERSFSSPLDAQQHFPAHDEVAWCKDVIHHLQCNWQGGRESLTDNQPRAPLIDLLQNERPTLAPGCGFSYQTMSEDKRPLRLKRDFLVQPLIQCGWPPQLEALLANWRAQQSHHGEKFKVVASHDCHKRELPHHTSVTECMGINIEIFSKLCPSQHPVGQWELTDHEGQQEAEREHDEHRDDEFEQWIERHRGEDRGHTDDHQRMDQVNREYTGG